MALQELLALPEYQGVEKVVWFDDEVHDWVTHLHGFTPELLAIAPHEDEGLTPAHLEEARRFLS